MPTPPNARGSTTNPVVRLRRSNSPAFHLTPPSPPLSITPVHWRDRFHVLSGLPHRCSHQRSGPGHFHSCSGNSRFHLNALAWMTAWPILAGPSPNLSPSPIAAHVAHPSQGLPP